MAANYLAAPLVLAIALAVGMPGVASAAIKCWTNKDGNRECGNAVPPEYAQQETRTINTRGITVDVQERAKTPEELAAEKEAERLKGEEKKRKEDQAARDRMLLSSYTTEKDLLAARDRAVGAIDASIEITNGAIFQLNRKLDENNKRAAGYERAGTPVPDDLKGDIASLETQVAEKKAYIDVKNQERADLLLKYEADLNRYRELKGGRSR